MRKRTVSICCWMLAAALMCQAVSQKTLASSAPSTQAAAMPAAIASAPGAATIAAERAIVYWLHSPRQAGITRVRVALPDSLQAAKRYTVVYVLPVRPGSDAQYGDGLAEVMKLKLPAKDDVIFVEPEFSALPWYADHPTNPTLQQESYFRQDVIPLIERAYPTERSPAGRLLLGFSKSGWGAWSLLLRHPDLFGRAAAWDAPVMMDWPSKYESMPIFGDRDRFEQHHVTRLLAGADLALGAEHRLILTGYGNFHAEHQEMHALLDRLHIPHVYRDGPRREHTWHSGWVAEAVELLLAPPVRAEPGVAPAQSE